MNSELFIYAPDATGATCWQQIELLEDVDIPLNFNVADIADFTKKNASYSKTITLPGSHTNNTIFKHLYKIETYGGFILDQSYQCYILQDSLVVFDGNFELTACKMAAGGRVVEYEAVVYSDSAELINEISKYYLRGNDDATNDLDFSAYDHILNFSNVRDSFYLTGATGYTYVPIDKTGHYFQDIQMASTWKLDELTPCLFIKEIWDKIFLKAGFEYESNFLTGATFSHLIYPHTDRWLRYDTEDVSDNTSLMEGEDSLHSFSINSSSYVQPTTQRFSYIGATFTQGANECFNESTGEFVAEVPGVYNVHAINRLTAAYLTIPSYTSDYVYNYKKQYAIVYARTVKVDLLGNETVIQDELGNNMEHQFFSWSSPNLTHPLGHPEARYSLFVGGGSTIDTLNIMPDGVVDYDTTGSTHLDIGEKIKTQIVGYITPKGSGATSYDWYLLSNDLPVAITFNIENDYVTNSLKVELDDRITDNCTVPVTQILHKEKQSDFINSIVKMFNLYMEPIGPKKLKIEPREEYYKLNTIPLDWTDKVAVDEEISVENGSDYRNSTIIMSYSSDTDEFNTNYTKTTEKMYGEYKKSENVSKEYKIEIMFAPTPCGGMNPDHEMQVPKIFSRTDSVEIEEEKNFKPRILYWKGLTDSLSGTAIWQVYDNKGVYAQTFPIYHWPYAGHFNDVYGADTLDLNFGACDWYWFNLNGTWATWNNLRNYYYGNLFDVLDSTETKLVTIKAVLSNRDISTLNFYRPIFIDGNYFKLNKIIDWIPNNLTTVELLKSYDITVTYPSKHPKPVIVKPIAISITKPLNYIDVFDANITADGILNNALDVDLFDANLTTYNTATTDVWNLANLRSVDYVDIVSADITNVKRLSIEEMRTDAPSAKKTKISSSNL